MKPTVTKTWDLTPELSLHVDGRSGDIHLTMESFPGIGVAPLTETQAHAMMDALIEVVREHNRVKQDARLFSVEDEPWPVLERNGNCGIASRAALPGNSTPLNTARLENANAKSLPAA